MGMTVGGETVKVSSYTLLEQPSTMSSSAFSSYPSGKSGVPLASSSSSSRECIEIMDGSTGRLLCEDYQLPDDTLFRQVWSAAALVRPEFHDKCELVAERYMDAGAKLITTNSFGCQPTYYTKVYGEEKYEEKMLQDAELSARLCYQARERKGGKQVTDVRILGALPPIREAHRPDYTKAYIRDKGATFVVNTFRKLVNAMRKGGVDVILMETMNNSMEALLALQGVEAEWLLDQGGDPDKRLPVIIALEGACRGSGGTWDLKPRCHESDQHFRAIIEWLGLESLESSDKNTTPMRVQVEAMGFNCAPPEEVLASLQALKPETKRILKEAGIKLCAYANVNDRKAVHDTGFSVSGDKPKDINKRADLVDLSADQADYGGYLDFVQKFIDEGVSMVGGCCGCGPEGINQIFENARNHGPLVTEDVDSQLSTKPPRSVGLESS